MNKLKKIRGTAKFHFSWDIWEPNPTGIYSGKPRDPWGFKFDFEWGNPNCFFGIFMTFTTPLFTGGIYA